MKIKPQIPKEVLEVLLSLENEGFLAYLVGGCVRDILMEKIPKDWDITTNARPKDLIKIFPDSIYENDFGTVGIKTKSEEENLKIIEVTTFRIESDYSDKRHPDKIKFADTIEDDLSRRDFTVNAMAISVDKNGGAKEIFDPFSGQKDLKEKIIKAVGDPNDRFNEDALRMLRAVRFACQLGFEIEEKTESSIRKNSSLLKFVSRERIRDEFTKIIMTDESAWGVQMLYALNLLIFIIPELLEGIDVGQNKHHIYTVWEHNLRALEYSTKKNYSFDIRLASLLHDVGKPRTKRGNGADSTFYAHEIIGARMARKILENLKFPKETIDWVYHLVRYHLFYYNVGEVSGAGVRRFIARVGQESIDDLIKIREADRIGSGVPKAVPYKLRHLLFMIEKVKKDPISPKMIKINGNDLMNILEIKPGPKVGFILNALLNEILDDPKKNEKDYLESRAKELSNLSDKELENLNKKARERKEEFEEGIEGEMKKKYYV